jgi:5-methylcytosine-specific restriction protein A
MEIDKNKIIFVTVDWMKYYRGITENDSPLGTGGSYPKEQKHEIYNFLEKNGICYGYTPPSGKLNLDKICKDEIKISPDGYKYIENVLVIFNGSNKNGSKRKVIGFYVGAIVFNKTYEDKYSEIIIKSSNEFAKYNVISKVENSFLIENENDRKIELPYSKNDGYGYGQSNIWYAEENNEKTISFRNKIINDIKNIINNIVLYENIYDEKKYFEGEVSKEIKEVSKIKRNYEARKKCLEYYFPNNEYYKCKICDFDFEETYGEAGKCYIEVHHIKSHAKKSKEIGKHEINPINDLIPVCSNCHSIIHRGKRPLEIEKIKEIVDKIKNSM